MTNKLTEINSKFYQEHGIIMLSTSESQIFIDTDGKLKFYYSKTPLTRPQHLYFISNEEIKAGDKVLHASNEVGEAIEVINDGKAIICTFPTSKKIPCVTYNLKKIIATTDKLLLTCNGVKREGESCSYNNNCKFPKCQLPRPSNEFLSKFCKLGGIDKVLVEYVDNGYEVDMEGRGGMDEGETCWMSKIELKVAPDNTIVCKSIEKTIEIQALEILKEELSKNKAGIGTLWDNLSLGSGYSQRARDIVNRILNLK